MPDILIELLCEEIPARMQIAAAEHLKKAITNGLVDAGLHYEDAKAFVNPRRLALHVVNVPIATKPQIVERKGPRVGAADGAIQGFLKAVGLASIDEAELQDDGKGGQFYIAKTQKDGQPTAAVLKPLIEKTIAEFPWPKSMRWGSGSLTWVRPLHNVCCTFSSDADVEVIEVEVENVTSKAETKGHTFLSPNAFAVKRFDDYVENLEKNYVVLDRERRKQIIWNDAKTAAFAQGLEVIPDEGLLEEIAGLVEWPVVLMGSFDEAFLSIPERVIQTTIRVNQKCFVLRQAPSLREGEADEAIHSSEVPQEIGLPRRSAPRNDGALSNHFILVSNLKATDGGATILAGNERVIRARLSDAKFFWENDQKVKLADRVEGLKNVVFHEKLGTQWDRVNRIEAIAGKIAQDLLLDELAAKFVKQSARLAKADLLTEMVGEFPELQGYMGKCYAEKEGLDSQVCLALEDHYKPRGPNESVPTDFVGAAVSLAEKIDMLVGFWSINEKPTGSKDPYALRRAAIGIVRILEKFENFPFPISTLISFGADEHKNFKDFADLHAFILERLRVQLVDLGFVHDQVSAVLAIHGNNQIAPIKARLRTLSAFLPTHEGLELLKAFHRANNILCAEEKKSGDGVFESDLDADKLLDSGRHIIDFFSDHALTFAIHKGFEGNNFEIILPIISTLSTLIHTYIENNMINDPNPEIRLNRLRLLAFYRRLTRTVADFEKIEG